MAPARIAQATANGTAIGTTLLNATQAIQTAAIHANAVENTTQLAVFRKNSAESSRRCAATDAN